MCRSVSSICVFHLISSGSGSISGLGSAVGEMVGVVSGVIVVVGSSVIGFVGSGVIVVRVVVIATLVVVLPFVHPHLSADRKQLMHQSLRIADY